MYISEGRSLEEVMEYMKQEQGFAPRYVERNLLPCAVYSWVDEKVRRQQFYRNCAFGDHHCYFIITHSLDQES